MHSYTVTVSEMGMTDTERSSLKPEHADKAGEGLVTAGMQQLEEQKANLSYHCVDGAVSTSSAGISEMQELLAYLWAILSSVVHLFSHWPPVPCSVQQQEKKGIEKKTRKFNKNGNS